MKTLIAILAAALLGIPSARAHEQHEHPSGPGLFGHPPEYIHVLLNPMPVYGMIIGTIALGAAALTSQRKFPKAATPLMLITLFAAITSAGAGGWISKAGGRIRHPELRPDFAPTNHIQNGHPHNHEQSEFERKYK